MVTLVWEFGSQELISSIAAFSTLMAVIVSLILARKGKVIKHKVVVNEKFCGLSIYNTGHAKFNITAFGIVDGKTIYYGTRVHYSKLLAESIQTVYNGTTYQDVSINAVCVEPGDLIEVGLEGFDFKLLKEKKCKLFIKINNKIHKYKINISNCDEHKNINQSKYKVISKKELNQSGYYFRRS